MDLRLILVIVSLPFGEVLISVPSASVEAGFTVDNSKLDGAVCANARDIIAAEIIENAN